jgi:NitT/TauT family transport system permease protein
MMDREKLMKLLPWISTPTLLIVIIGLWKLCTVVFDISRFVLPPPEDVAVTLWALMGQADVWLVHARITSSPAPCSGESSGSSLPFGLSLSRCR